MIIAQISDLHVRTDGHLLKGKIDSIATLNAAIEHVNALSPRPDLLLITGDLANKAHNQDYTFICRELNRLNMPAYVIPGNHDNRDMMRENFTDRGYLPADSHFLHYVLEDFPLRMIGLDTKRNDHDGGEMCDERLQWLEGVLSDAPERPSMIFMHHPPFETGIDFMDNRPFVNADKLEHLVKQHSQITGVICGHTHRKTTVSWGNTIASIAPSVAYQMTMDFTPDAKPSFMLEPAGCPILLWNEDRGLTFHCSQIGDYGPPNRFVIDPL